MLFDLTTELSGVANLPKACVFLDDVLCSYRKSEEFGVMERCFRCPHYRRFIREMDKEEEEFFEEVERARERVRRGERSRF